MESLMFVLIILIVSLFGHGSFVQTSRSMDNIPSAPLPQSTGGDRSDVKDAFTEESSGSRAPESLTSWSVLPMEDEHAVSKEHADSGVMLPSRPTLTPKHSEAQGQGADKANVSITGYALPGVPMVPEETAMERNYSRPNEQSNKQMRVEDSVTDFERSTFARHGKMSPSTANQQQSGPRGPCALGAGPCVVLKNLTGTSLLWDDMRRTLTFAWELHVFGSASLFTVMVALAVIGFIAAYSLSLPYPLCNALIISNFFLIVVGSLRTVLLLLDPYGTRQILSHSILAVLHNVPLSLLLWTQAILAIVTLRGTKWFIFPIKLQCVWMVGAFALSHSTALLITDLYSSALPSTFPLLLQSLSICWGISLCLGILTKSLTHLHTPVASLVQSWMPSHRTEKRTRRLMAVCAFLGVLCCSLHMYSLFWLYGLLGNWRLFSWGWWLSQFWARILESAWGFSQLALCSWIFCSPSKSHSRSDHWLGRGDVSKGAMKQSLWCRILKKKWKDPLRKPDKTWEELMPNNWAKYNLSKAAFSSLVMCPYEAQPCTVLQQYNSELVDLGMHDTQDLSPWQKVSDCECTLSVLEFDVSPPSPINLRRSIDDALYHGRLIKSLFTPSLLSWTQSADIIDSDPANSDLPPNYVSYRWMLDAESIMPSPDHFRVNEPILFPGATAHCNGTPSSANVGDNILHLTIRHNWSGEDITDL